jgi:hypothetical protein
MGQPLWDPSVGIRGRHEAVEQSGVRRTVLLPPQKGPWAIVQTRYQSDGEIAACACGAIFQSKALICPTKFFSPLTHCFYHDSLFFGQFEADVARVFSQAVPLSGPQGAPSPSEVSVLLRRRTGLGGEHASAAVPLPWGRSSLL